MKPIRRPSREALAWLGAESALQRRRCRALAAADAALARRRARWAEEFLARLATRGFDEAAGVRRPVRPEELPAARGRRLRATTAPTGRPHIERGLDRAVPWRALRLPGFPRGLGTKVLSVDPGTGAASLRLRYARGAGLPGGYSDSDVELFVVRGAVDLGATRHGAGSYLYVPRGVALPALACPRGAELLAFYVDGPPSFTPSDSDHPRAERERLVVVDAVADLDWDAASTYPAALPGRLVKVLHVEPRSRALTCLVALAPQFRRDAVGYADCATEEVVLAGELWTLQSGPRPAGSYAWRPAYANQGPVASERGALVLVRSAAELVVATHFNPWSTPAENRAQAASRLRHARPELYAAIAAGRRTAPADFEFPVDAAPRRGRRRARP